MTGREFPELEVGEIPEELKYIWYWFLMLHNNRSSSGFGSNPITYQDMWFYFQLEGIEPESWEIDLIKQFDNIYMQNMSEQQKKEQQKAKSKSSK